MELSIGLLGWLRGVVQLIFRAVSVHAPLAAAGCQKYTHGLISVFVGLFKAARFVSAIRCECVCFIIIGWISTMLTFMQCDTQFTTGHNCCSQFGRTLDTYECNLCGRQLVHNLMHAIALGLEWSSTSVRNSSVKMGMMMYRQEFISELFDTTRY